MIYVRPLKCSLDIHRYYKVINIKLAFASVLFIDLYVCTCAERAQQLYGTQQKLRTETYFFSLVLRQGFVVFSDLDFHVKTKKCIENSCKIINEPFLIFQVYLQT